MPEPIQSGAQKQQADRIARAITDAFNRSGDLPPESDLSEAILFVLRDSPSAETPVAPTDHHDQTQNARYLFSDHQMYRVLGSAISMFLEYRDQHGKDEGNAAHLAAQEIIEGLDTEQELIASGEVVRTPSQVILSSPPNAARSAPIKPESSLPSKGALRAAKAICDFTDDHFNETEILRIANLLDSETGLPELLQALKPFAEVAPELRKIGSIARKEQWLWKPSSNTRETKGINAQHILDAEAALSRAGAEQQPN